VLGPAGGAYLVICGFTTTRGPPDPDGGGMSGSQRVSVQPAGAGLTGRMNWRGERIRTGTDLAGWGQEPKDWAEVSESAA
jgi:hypothetical protein